MHAINDQGEVSGLVSCLSLESNLCQGAWGCAWLRMTSQMLFWVHLIFVSHWPGSWVMGYLIWVDFASHGPKPLGCVCLYAGMCIFGALGPWDVCVGVCSPRMWDLWAFDSGSQVVMSLSCFEEGFVLRCELSAAWGLCTRCRFSIWGLYLQVVWCFWVIRSSVFLLRGFSTRLVSVQSGSEVSLRDVKYLCNSHLFLSWRPCSVCRLFVAVCLVSVVFEGLRLKLWALCADTQWPIFGVTGYLP